MKILARYLGGSHSYGLATENSDKDDRYLFLHTEIGPILGLDRHEHECKQSETEDVFGWEVRHALNLLRRGNTAVLEMFFNENWIEKTPEFTYIQGFRDKLIDSHKLYKCLKGYAFSERRLVLGERSGVLGGKRRLHLEQYGYSFKNLVQYLRLCLAGEMFFQTGVFPVNIRVADKEDLLYKIKTSPESFIKDQAIVLMDEYERRLDASYNNIKIIYTYDQVIANQICFDLYYPILKPHAGHLNPLVSQSRPL